MALIMNDYRPTNMAGTIRRHEHREHAHSRISDQRHIRRSLAW